MRLNLSCITRQLILHCLHWCYITSHWLQWQQVRRDPIGSWLRQRKGHIVLVKGHHAGSKAGLQYFSLFSFVLFCGKHL
jgi:hypothetical protein